MQYFLFFIFLSCLISSDDKSVEMDGTIGDFRYIMLSENTLGNKVEDLSTSGSDQYLIGSIEINLFNNIDGGSVYITNLEYQDSIFRALQNGSLNNQIRVSITSNTNTDGTVSSPAYTLTPAKKTLIRTTTGTVIDEKITLRFYAKNDPDNSLANGNFLSHFTFIWED